MKLLTVIFALTYMLNINQCHNTDTAQVDQSSEPCYTDREKTEEISEVRMICMMLGDGVLLHIDGNKSKRYSVCNQTKYTFEEGKAYTISGICYKVKPNERWPGTPFQITSLMLLE